MPFFSGIYDIEQGICLVWYNGWIKAYFGWKGIFLSGICFLDII